MKKIYQITLLSFLLFVSESCCMFSSFLNTVTDRFSKAQASVGSAIKQHVGAAKANLTVPKIMQTGQKISPRAKAVCAVGGVLAAMIANAKKAKAEHVFYRKGENDEAVPLDKKEYEKVAEVVDQYQWPTAIRNPDYNPDVDETKVIQEKLDQQFPGVKATWVSDTLFDAVDYVTHLNKDIAQNYSSKVVVNKAVIDTLGKDLQKIEMLDPQQKKELFKKHVSNQVELSHYSTTHKNKVIPLLHKTIDVEVDLKYADSSKTLFFRGYTKGIDFNKNDSYDIVTKQSESMYARTLAGENETHKKTNIVPRNIMGKGAASISFGDRMLSNIYYGGECPAYYVALLNDPQVGNRGFALPISKKSLMINNNQLFALGNDMDDKYSFTLNHTLRPPYKKGSGFHPRAKAHVSDQRQDINAQQYEGFTRTDNRVMVHQTQQEARQAYADYFKYTLDHAIPLTPETTDDLKKAKKAFSVGKKIKILQSRQTRNLELAKKLNQTVAVKSSSVYDKKQQAARMIEICGEKTSTESRSAEKSKR
ncbi:hypothetical protein IPH25_00280 [bacterium]|nr:MAG: hypothetical protein IPG37_02395 [bacterium]QQR61870.1 MAG: hypothetical protein IPH25_00280 [bacterium]QQR62549.1 MAG: hypothetical protein IPH67_03960 [bacterium]